MRNITRLIAYLYKIASEKKLQCNSHSDKTRKHDSRPQYNTAQNTTSQPVQQFYIHKKLINFK
jgi:hypothetical protein